MKMNIFKRMSLVLLYYFICSSTQAQNETHSDFITRTNFIFANLEKNRVPNGLLLDYAMELADLKIIMGSLRIPIK